MLNPEYFVDVGQWELTIEDQFYSAPTIRELLTKLPEGRTIANYHPGGVMVIRPHTDEPRAPRMPIGLSKMRHKEKMRTPPNIPTAVESARAAHRVVSAPPKPYAQPIKRLDRHTVKWEVRGQKGWTDGQIEHLKQLFNEGYSAGQIARQLYRTRNAVIGKLTRIGLMGCGKHISKAHRRLDHAA